MQETMETPARVAAQTPEDESERLKKLVAELVEKNQTLRFEVAALKRKTGADEDVVRFVLLW